MLKSTLKIILALTFLAVAAMSAQAKEVTVGKLKYKVNTTSKIARCTGLATAATKNYNLTIPATITYNNTTLKVISVEENAFSWDNYLRDVTLSDNVETIGKGAFSNCKNLRNVSLGNRLNKIGNSAFQHSGNSGSFTTIRFPRSVETVGDEAFADCRYLSSITLNGGLRSLGYCAIWGCVSLKSITLPGSLQSIGEKCFACCENLEAVSFTYGDGNGRIGEKCFDNLKKITRLDFAGASIATIGNSAFINCNIEWLSLPPSLRTIEQAAFAVNRLSSLYIPEGVQTIGRWAFSDQINGRVHTLTLPSTLQSIGVEAFNGLSTAFPEGIPSVICNAIAPPVCGEKAFDSNTLENSDLTVPAESLWRYRTTAVWQDFRYKNENHAGVENLETDCEEGNTTLFDLQGHKIDRTSAAPGLYIELTPDGKARKVKL